MATLVFGLFLVMATSSVVMTTTNDVDGNRNVMSILKTMQEKFDHQLNLLQNGNTALQQKVNDLENQMHSMKTTVNDVQEEINELKKENGELTFLKEKNAALEKRLELVEKNITYMPKSAQVDSLFLATISEELIEVSDDEPIIWDTALINHGDDFNTVLGAYTAPTNGFYQFSVAKRGQDFSSEFWLLVDEVTYLYLDMNLLSGASAAPTSCVTINLELTAGQIVRVENDVSQTVYGTSSEGVIFSWFTGYLLQAL